VIPSLFRTLRLGFKSLLLHKLRSGLAMLGILIGVTAVIWLVALGEGVSYQAQQQIKDLGATNIIIKSVKPPSSSSQGSSFIVNYGLTRDDFERITASVPTIRRAVPMREAKSQAGSRGRMADVNLLGCTPDYFQINHLAMDRGRFLEDRDLQARDNVVVIAEGSAKEIFPFEDPVGRTLQVLVNGSLHLYTIIGQTKSRTPSAAIGGSLAGRDYNLDIYIPISTFRARIGDQVITVGSGTREGELVQLNQITVTVGNIEEVEAAAGIIEFLLEKFHKDKDYSVVVPKELLKQAEMLRMMFNVLLVLIAGISLVVGGIGIMNIMLATVTERTREIGVRRAMGAKQKDIIVQFLSETMVLSATGGCIGVVLGFSCIWIVPALKWVALDGLPNLGVNTLAEYWNAAPTTIQNLEPLIAPWSIVAAFVISVGVGVTFGLYPAFRAAQMDPIEALRHE
jgi:putative ABC transport system permease protein